MLLFVPVQGCEFTLVCTGAGSLLLCVTCKKPSKKEEEALLKQARDKSDLFSSIAAAAAAAELLRGGTKLPGHYPWKAIRKLTATSPAQIASPPLPRQTQGMGAQEQEGEGVQEGKKGTGPFPKRMEMNWKGVGGDQRGQTVGFLGYVSFLLQSLPLLSGYAFFFFKFYS